MSLIIGIVVSRNSSILWFYTDQLLPIVTICYQLSVTVTNVTKWFWALRYHSTFLGKQRNVLEYYAVLQQIQKPMASPA